MKLEIKLLSMTHLIQVYQISKIIKHTKPAEMIKEFIETLSLVSGSFVGTPFKVLDWQYDFIKGVFSLYDENNHRVVNEALLTIAKKNGKTEYVAAIVLAFTLVPFLQQKEGEIIIVAGTKDQASILYGVIKKFIEYDETLISLFIITPSKREIWHKTSNMKIKVMASDMDTSQGINPYLVVVDEIGNIEKVKAQKLLDGLLNAFGAQEQPLFIQLSTQSPDHSHPFSLKVTYAQDIIDGKKEDINFFGAVHSMPDDCDIYDEENWVLANPSIEAIPSIKKQIQKSLKTAKYNPAAMAQIRAYLFNQRYSSEVSFIGVDTWMKCQAEFDVTELHGCKAWGGLDLAGGKQDLSSLQLVVQGRDDSLYVVSYFWTAENGLYDKAERDGVPYQEWKSKGYLNTMPGDTTNWREMTQQLLDICEIYDVEEIYYDRWKIYEIQRELAEIGDDLPITPLGQGYKDQTPCVDALEEYIFERKIWCSSPVLTWNVANAIVSIDPSMGRKFDKKKAIGRIDGCVALGMAVRCHQENNRSRIEEIVFI